MTYRVTIGNNKGGSGKTAAVCNLAAALAERGHSVLVVDMDPQANASRRLGWAWSPEAPTPTVSEALKDNTVGVAAQAITACGWEGETGARVRLLPARWDLENRISEAGTVGAAARLRTVLQGVDDDVDVTLIDCPPSLGHLPQMAMAAAHAVLCTVEPEYDSVEGAVRYRDFVAAHARDLGNPQLHMAGYVVSRVRAKLGAHDYQLEGFPELFGAERIWRPYVPERTAHKDAADAAVPLRTWATPAAREMAAIWSELAGMLVGQHASKPEGVSS